MLWQGLGEMNLKLVVEEKFRLPTLTTVYTPEGVDEAALRKRLLFDYNIEIAGGLGTFKGKAWRIGLMGYSNQFEVSKQQKGLLVQQTSNSKSYHRFLDSIFLLFRLFD